MWTIRCTLFPKKRCSYSAPRSSSPCAVSDVHMHIYRYVRVRSSQLLPAVTSWCMSALCTAVSLAQSHIRFCPLCTNWRTGGVPVSHSYPQVDYSIPPQPVLGAMYITEVDRPDFRTPAPALALIHIQDAPSIRCSGERGGAGTDT